jgi:hypothetical protein
MKIGEILSFHEHLFSLVVTTVYMKFHIGYSLQWYFCCPHSFAIDYSNLNVSAKNIFNGRNLTVSGGSNILYNMSLQPVECQVVLCRLQPHL